MWSKSRREGARILGLLALLVPAGIADVDAQPQTPTLASVGTQPPLAPSGHGQLVPVFFVPGSAELDAAAERITARVAEIALAASASRFTVTGHFAADTEDPALARRRADTLRGSLAAHGLSGERIRVEVARPRDADQDPTPFSPLSRRADISVR
jgi:outer membrane protein OmpA-like peptidoglycan-associated protein